MGHTADFHYLSLFSDPIDLAKQLYKLRNAIIQCVKEETEESEIVVPYVSCVIPFDANKLSVGHCCLV